MVGLTELGEFAYDVEKLHNRLLEEERPVTAAVLRMIRGRAGHVPRMGRRAAREGPRDRRIRKGCTKRFAQWKPSFRVVKA